MFGTPEIEIAVEKGVIQEVRVLKGAPCGATWHAAEEMKGLPVEEALTRFGLEVQFVCSADPAAWDPLWGKSPVHMAADIHSATLTIALKNQDKK